MKLRLTTRKERTRLKWQVNLVIFLVFFIAFLMIMRDLNLYLSPTKKVDSKFMVVEGFLPDYTLKQVVKEFHEGDYEHILITGKPMGQGYYIAGVNADSDLVRASLMRMGMDSTKMTSIAIPATVFRDRTYNTGLILYNYLRENNLDHDKVNVYTLGCHARRSQVLFQKAVGDEIEIGIIAGEDRSYDRKKWWKSSKGFRTVINETLAYLYVSIVFHPDIEQSLNDLDKGYYIDEIQNHRNDKDIQFANTNRPLTEEQRETFSSLNYFPVNEKFNVKVKFIEDPIKREFEMPTSTDRLPIYRNYGKLHFMIDGEEYTLTAYQNMGYLESNPGSDYLFIPYNDLTNAIESYGGGRYLDFAIPKTDSVYLDFNLSYNPLCSYNHRYSCPVPPEENELNVRIEAGEMNYDDH